MHKRVEAGCETPPVKEASGACVGNKPIDMYHSLLKCNNAHLGHILHGNKTLHRLRRQAESDAKVS